MAPVQPNASVAATGLGIRYIGQYCYAYSGEVAVANTELALLEFTSSGIIVGELQVGSNSAENEDYEMKIYFNDQIIFSNTFHQQGATYVNIASAIPLIIPPYTNVKVTLDNIADTDSRIWTVGITGKVYGAEE